MLKLSTSVRLPQLPQLWAGLQASLQVEARQLRNGAGVQLQISAAELSDFDSGVLTLLLSAMRLCAEEGVRLQVCQVPAKLQELARVYGVAELLWPELLSDKPQLA